MLTTVVEFVNEILIKYIKKLINTFLGHVIPETILIQFAFKIHIGIIDDLK